MKDEKKLLAVFGSPHREGPTRRLLDPFLEPFRLRDWSIETVDAYALGAKPCLDCGLCGREEGCAQHDLDPLDRSLRQSQVLVIASPVYNDSFPAPLKALLDRTQRYYSARFSLGLRPPIQTFRKAALLLTMGSTDPFPVEVTTRQLERAFSVMNTRLVGTAVWNGLDRGEGEKTDAMEKASRLALEILSQM